MAKDLVRVLQVLFPHCGHSIQDVCWRPAADVYRTRDGWLIKLDLAGVKPEDISVSAQGKTVTVRGERRDWFGENAFSCYAMEIAYSRFERTLTLPCVLDGATVVAEYREGMLLIRIKTEET